MLMNNNLKKKRKLKIYIFHFRIRINTDLRFKLPKKINRTYEMNYFESDRWRYRSGSSPPVAEIGPFLQYCVSSLSISPWLRPAEALIGPVAMATLD